MFIEREFFSEGATLKGRWYGAENGPKAPCIVMCHGTSATITMCLSDYASEFQKNGFNVFLFDHAGFGASGGAVRQTINPWVQAKGISDAVDFVRTLDQHHNGRIVLWGDSFAGMLVLTVGAVVKDLAGIVSFTASFAWSFSDFLIGMSGPGLACRSRQTYNLPKTARMQAA